MIYEGHDLCKCTNLPNNATRRASSINTHDRCVRLFDNVDCIGRSVDISLQSHGHDYLGLREFDNSAVSLVFCDPQVETLCIIDDEELEGTETIVAPFDEEESLGIETIAVSSDHFITWVVSGIVIILIIIATIVAVISINFYLTPRWSEQTVVFKSDRLMEI